MQKGSQQMILRHCRSPTTTGWHCWNNKVWVMTIIIFSITNGGCGKTTLALVHNYPATCSSSKLLHLHPHQFNLHNIHRTEDSTTSQMVAGSRGDHPSHNIKRSVSGSQSRHHDIEHDAHSTSLHNWKERIQQQLPQRRNTTLRFAFSALATLVIPSLIRYKHKSGSTFAFTGLLGHKDVIAFVLCFTALSLSDAVRTQTLNHMQRLKQWGRRVLRHSSPSLSDPRKLLFRNENDADRVTAIGAFINTILSIGKLWIGVKCHSAALIADAGHSLSDLFSDGITLYAVQIGRLPPDDDHPYGHGKFEAIGSLFLALTLLGTGLSVGAASNKRLMEIIAAQRSRGGVMASKVVAQQIPTMPALVMAGISIVSKEWLYRITRKVGEKLNSQVVIANACHHRSDAYSSVLALISIGLAMSVPGLLAADSAAGLLVAGMICMTGAEILGESVNQLTDTANEELGEKVTQIAKKSEDVVNVHRVRARQVGSSALVDVAITIANGLSSSAARIVEERVRWKIIDECANVIDAEVHATGPKVVGPLSPVSNESQTRTAVADVEEEVRKILLSESQLSAVRSVEGVTVHYQDSSEATSLVNVDVDVRLADPTNTTVARASKLASKLRHMLESSTIIDKANIFLVLNEDTMVPSL